MSAYVWCVQIEITNKSSIVKLILMEAAVVVVVYPISIYITCVFLIILHFYIFIVVLVFSLCDLRCKLTEFVILDFSESFYSEKPILKVNNLMTGIIL